MIDDGHAGEEHGEVWSTALAWSGSWRISVDRSPSGRLTWTGGFGHEGVTWRLRPGETLDHPAVRGPVQHPRVRRDEPRLARPHRPPRPARSRHHRPIVYNSWEATGWAVNEANQRRLAAMAAGSEPNCS